MQETPDSDQLKRGAAISSERQAAVSHIKPCSLLDYCGYVGHLPRPSEEQIENWVQFVSQAHSWYKHLPLLPPGQPFHFFIDPFSGYDRIIQPGGSVINRERTEDSFRFHYTWMTTREYRRRFGHLAYESGAGSNFIVQSGGEAREYGDLPIFNTDAGPWHIPTEVAEAGMVELTSQIHPDVTSVSTWGMMLQIAKERATEGRSRQWPSETGGEDTFRQIKGVTAAAQESNRRLSEAYEACASLMHRDLTSVDTWRMMPELECQEASSGGTDQGPLEQLDEETRRQIEKVVVQARASRQRLHATDDALESLILPEKRRLRRNMTEAINRMLALVYDRGQ